MGDQIRKNAMGGAFGRYGRERELHTWFGQENLKVRNHLAELILDRVRLKWI
jgi:hypothetical protein